jgi:hypothetical protein
VRLADDQQVVAEARIGVGIRNHHGRASGQQGMVAERVRARNFRRIEPDPSLEPNPPVIDKRDEADRRGKQRRGGANQLVEAIFGRGVEDAIPPQLGEMERLVDG